MNKSIAWGLSTAVLLLVLTCSLAVAQTDYPLSVRDEAVEDALLSLANNQSTNGSIHNIEETTAAVWAFAAASVDPYDVRTSEDDPSAMDYLADNSENLSSAMDYAHYILSISASADDANSYEGHNYTQDLLAEYSGGQFGNASLLYDDMYALLALVSAGMNTGNPTVNSTYNYIKSHQNADGGWGSTPSGASDTDNTALAVLALMSAGESPSSTNITGALNFTKSRQNNDGGFGFNATDTQSNAYSDALAMMAIRAADDDPTSSTWTENNTTPAEHLLSLQRADGSFWQGSFDTTPYAVIALVGKLYPVHGYINFLRVEGKNNTLFDDELFYSTPYTAVADNSGEPFDVLREPSVAVLLETLEATTGMPVLSTDTYGDYFVKGINGENNSGVVGWRYAVDYEIPSLAADRYVLKQDEDVLWFYAHVASTVLSRLSIPEAVAVNTSFVAVATYYDQASGMWKPLEGGYVWVDINSTETPSKDNGTPYWLSPRNGTPIAGPTDAAGMVNLSFNSTGRFELWCAGEKSLEYPGGDWTQIARSESRELCAGPEGEPDLTVFMGLSAFAAVGEPIHIVGDVWNIGGGHANNSTLVVFANGTPIENVSVNALASGCDFRFDFNYTPSSEGRLNITAIADYYDVVNESNENNNTRTVYVDVGEMPSAVMYMYPEVVWAKPNSTFTVAVNISSMEPLIVAFSNISFNTTALEVVSQTNGQYMVQDGMPTTTVQKNYDNNMGYASYNETRRSPVGVMGTGTLYTLTFRVKQDAPFGAYTLDFINVSVLLNTTGKPVAPILVPCIVNVSNNTQPTAVGSVKYPVNNAHSNTYFNGSASYDPDHTGVGNGIVQYLWDFGDSTITSTGENITSHVYMHYIWNDTSSTYMPFTVNLTVFDSGGAYNYTYIPVVVYMAGDANGDGVANILDAALVGLHWNAPYGSADYHDGADLNNDDVVNVLDAAIVGLNWNERAVADLGGSP